MDRGEPGQAVEEKQRASLIEGEPEDTPYAEDAQTWIAVYGELLEFAHRWLSRSEPGGDLFGLVDRPDALQAHVERLRNRLNFWQQRFWQLGGLELDLGRRLLSYGGKSSQLTVREAQLLEYLARHPNQAFSGEQLVAKAWQAPELTQEQLRTYVVRLRRKLAQLEMPCELVTRPGAGYALVSR
jgi:DNA-binding response OmpR family regulator